MCEFYAGRKFSMTNFLKRFFISNEVLQLKEQWTEAISAGLSLIQQRFIYVTIFLITLNIYTFLQTNCYLFAAPSYRNSHVPRRCPACSAVNSSRVPYHYHLKIRERFHRWQWCVIIIAIVNVTHISSLSAPLSRTLSVSLSIRAWSTWIVIALNFPDHVSIETRGPSSGHYFLF